MTDSAPAVRFIVPGAPTSLLRQKHGIAYGRDGKPLLNKLGKPFVRNWKPAQSVEAQVNVRTFAYEAMGGRPPLRGAVELRMSIYVRIPLSWSQKKQRAAMQGQIIPTTTPDSSNILKLVEDGLKDLVIYDDKQIADIHVWRRYSDRPRVLVEIHCLDQTELPLVSAEPKLVTQSPLVGSLRT